MLKVIIYKNICITTQLMKIDKMQNVSYSIYGFFLTLEHTLHGQKDRAFRILLIVLKI